MGAREYVVGSEIEDGNIPYSNCRKSIKDSWFISISTPVPTSTGLATSTGSARSVYLEGTRYHNEGRVSTLACYLLL